MVRELSLKNSPRKVLLDEEAYVFLCKNEELQRIKFFENLRSHSSGYAFFQKNWRQDNGSYECQTIYLHKLIAEQYIQKPKMNKRLFVRFNNGNPLDCRMENLEWTSLSNVVRNTDKTVNKFGYRGVVKDRGRYRAVIYYDRKPINLGSFDTAKDAAIAYNKKSIELFGNTRSINDI